MYLKLPLIGALAVGIAMSADDAAAAGNPQVSIETSMGKIVVELYPDKAPKTVENFLKYVEDGFYSGTIFHRVIGTFMVQGGGFTEDLYEGNLKTKPGNPPVAIESQNGLKNDKGWLAMARTSDPNSATSQFFINTVDNDSLNYPSFDGHGYAVFGKVVEGMDVVGKIAAVKTGTVGPLQDVPADAVKIEGVTKLAD